MEKRDDTPRRRGMGGAAKAGAGSGRMFHVKHSSSRKPGTGRREGGLRGGARRRAERGIGRVEVRGRGAGSGAQAGRGPVGGGATGTRARRGPGGARAEAGRRRRRSAVPVGATQRARAAKASRMRMFHVKHARGARCGRDAEAPGGSARRSDALPGNDTPPEGSTPQRPHAGTRSTASARSQHQQRQTARQHAKVSHVRMFHVKHSAQSE